ncbi:MAG TPA: winged helix DNA-binding domain-containing protein [Pyrinomonadaceae bacterium]|nr:winged helix DNA-binding domain-containing protein [Pyrinomonadaceae bacterium]
MKSFDVARQRLRNQQLSSPKFTKAGDVVKWMGAVQAQDYYGAKWALGQRMLSATDEDIERAFAHGKILRTHIMRPTWHFVSPADIRWMLKLTAPRVNACNSHYYRKLELDERVFRQSNKVLVAALRGGKQLTRDILRNVLQQARISTSGLRLVYILARAELDGVICSGARQGKQFTYALLDERAPQTKDLSRDECLSELTRRYFASHGPATVQDFVWWSGLTVADAKAGIEMTKRRLVQEVVDGQTYWLPASTPAARGSSQAAYLLPTYDEYLIAYKDRGFAVDSIHGKQAISRNPVFSSPIVIAGRVVGSWKRSFKESSVVITINPFSSFGKSERQTVDEAAQRYGSFLNMRVVLA